MVAKRRMAASIFQQMKHESRSLGENALAHLMRYYGDTDGRKLCIHELTESIENELVDLQQQLEEYEDYDKPAKLRRFGLPYFCKEYLKQ